MLPTRSFNLNATASSGLTVTYTASPSGIISISGSTFTVLQPGAVTITAKQNGNITYKSATATQALTINAGSQTLSWTTVVNNSLQFVANMTGTFIATATSNLPVVFTASPSDVLSITGSNYSVLKAGAVTVTASQPGNGSFGAANTVSQSFLFYKRPQTLTFQKISPSTITFVPGLSGTLTVSSDAGLTVNISATPGGIISLTGTSYTVLQSGSVTISVSQAGDSYNAAAPTLSQTLTFVKTNQTLSFPTILPFNIYYTADLTNSLIATTTSGLAPFFTASPPGIVTIDNNVGSYTVLQGGTVTITATQPGNPYYNAASPISQTLNFVKADQSIVFPTISPSTLTYTPSLTGSLNAFATSALAVQYSATPGGILSINSDGTYSVLSAGTVTITVSQSGNGTYNAAQSVSQTLTITPASQTLTFTLSSATASYSSGSGSFSGSASSGLAVTYSASPSGIINISGSSYTIVGVGTGVITASQSGNSAYSAATPVSQSLTITALYLQCLVLSFWVGVGLLWRLLNTMSKFTFDWL